MWRKITGLGKPNSPEAQVPVGVEIVYDPKDATIDIVFLHGLGGHRRNTWCHETAEMPWPQAWLHENIETARVMLYGYNANVVDWKQFLGKVSENAIKNHAETLLAALALNRRKEANHRPIIFVCHSLGGIVCKDALVRSRQWSSQPHLLSISQSTRGIIFLGTPHKGSDLAAWAKRLGLVVGLFKHVNTKIIAQLEANSKDLKGIQDSFNALLKSRQFDKLPVVEVQCFYEEIPITNIGRVVDNESAELNENPAIGINKDHHQMTKFRSKYEEGYKQLCFTIERWMEDLGMPTCQEPPATPASSSLPRGSMTPSLVGMLSPDRQASPRASDGRSSPLSSSSSTGFVKIPPGGRFIVNAEVVRLPIKHVPERLRGHELDFFEPREKDMLEMDSCFFRAPQLHQSSESHRSFVITGLGGAGKTELALRFVQNFEQRFEAIFVVVADTESRLSAQFSELALHLGLIGASENTNQELCSAVFRTWLGDPVRGAPDPLAPKPLVKWLLVFDNAESSDTLKKFWPSGGHGNILVTSRNPLLAAPELKFKGKTHLSGLPIDNAAHLLRLLANDNENGGENTEKDARELSSWVDGFPLAIKQIGNTIRSDELSISQFLQRYPSKDSLRPRLYDSSGDGSTFITAWALETMLQDQPDTFRFLCIIAMLDPECIEENLLKPQSATLTDSAMDTSRFLSLRRQLSAKSLLVINRIDQTISIHRVVQDVAVRMALNCGSAASICCDAVARVAASWPFLNRNYATGSATMVSRWEQCRKVYYHIVRLLEVYHELSAASVIHLPSTDLAELLLEAVQYRVECGFGHEAVPLLDAVEDVYKPSQSMPVASAEEIGKYYRGRIALAVSSRDPDNMLRFSQLAWNVEIERHKKRGKSTSILAVTYNDLAVSWACHGEWTKALELLEQSATIRKQLQDFARHKLFSPLYHKGLVLYHQGKYDEAEKILNEAINDREQTFGSGDADSIRAALMYARGNVRLARRDEDRQDIKNAKFDHLEAVSRASRASDRYNRSTLICQYQVARVFAALGQFATACIYLEEVLQNTLDNPTYYRDIARSSYLYATCLRSQSQHRKADEEFSRSLQIYNYLCPNLRRTASTLTEGDIASLIPYDYL